MAILFLHLLTTATELFGPGGAKAIIAEKLLLKQQLLVVTHSRRRAPNLSNADRLLLGFWSLFLCQGGIAKIALSIRPSTLLTSYSSSDRDPLFEYQQWQTNLSILEIEPIETVPYTPISHPFVRRLIGTIRREFYEF